MRGFEMTHFVLWACEDCYFESVDDEDHPYPTHYHEDHTHYPAYEPNDVTLGRDYSECDHDPDSDWDSVAHSEDCETEQFSKRPCAICGCTLAGARFAMTEWMDD